MKKTKRTAGGRKIIIKQTEGQLMRQAGRKLNRMLAVGAN